MLELPTAVYVVVIGIIIVSMAYAWFKWLNRNPYPTPPRTSYKPQPEEPPCPAVVPNDGRELTEWYREITKTPSISLPSWVHSHADDYILQRESRHDLFVHDGADQYVAYLRGPNGKDHDYYRITKFDSHVAQRTGKYDRDHIKYIGDGKGGVTYNTPASRALVMMALKTSADEDWED